MNNFMPGELDPWDWRRLSGMPMGGIFGGTPGINGLPPQQPMGTAPAPEMPTAPAAPTAPAPNGGGIFGNFGNKLTAGLTALQTDPRAQLGLRILANSGYSKQKRGLGEILGTSVLQGQEAQQQTQEQDLKRRYIEAQMEAMRAKQAPGTHVIDGQLVDDTGRVIYKGSPQAKPMDPAGQLEQDYRNGLIDKSTYQKRMGLLTSRQPGVQVNVGDKLPPPPQGQAYLPDPTSPWGFKLGPIPGAKDSRTEFQQKSASQSARMAQLSKDILDTAPSTMSQYANDHIQQGGIKGSVANKILSSKEQVHFNAARGWLAGILRGDSGATITPAEWTQYYPTYFPIPNDGADVIAQKKALRAATLKSMRDNSGIQAPATNPGIEAPIQPQQTPYGELQPQRPASDIAARAKGYY
jgi:hypothetical protein